ncbi:MAG TPA: hypothetical protein VN648_33725, partial [Candidatus Methylomirabilis sp.]|nr:hypothetical protein [Candidatus Methylomirabilis sp.]
MSNSFLPQTKRRGTAYTPAHRGGGEGLWRFSADLGSAVLQPDMWGYPRRRGVCDPRRNCHRP